MTIKQSFEEIENLAFNFFDKHGIAYKLNSGIRITVDLNDELDEIERLINGIRPVEELRHIENWESFSNIEFIIPSAFRSHISLELYQEVVFSYLKHTLILKQENISEHSLNKIGLLHIQSHYGENLEKSKDFTGIWGYGLKGLFVMPKKNIIGDILLNRPKLHKSIQNIHGNLIINSEMEDLGLLKTIQGDVIFSSKVTQAKLSSLNPIEKIGGNCILNNLIINLDSLKTVQGNLNIRKCLVKSLNANIVIGGNLLLSRYNLPLLRNTIDTIDLKGKKRIYSDYYHLDNTDENWIESILKSAN